MFTVRVVEMFALLAFEGLGSWPIWLFSYKKFELFLLLNEVAIPQALSAPRASRRALCFWVSSV